VSTEKGVQLRSLTPHSGHFAHARWNRLWLMASKPL
jgi:hypothetical protein